MPCVGSARRRCPHTQFSLSLLCLRSSPSGSGRARCQARLLLEVGLRLFPGHLCKALRCKRCCVARLPAVARLPESQCCHLACFFLLLACRVASFARPQEQVLLHAPFSLTALSRPSSPTCLHLLHLTGEKKPSTMLRPYMCRRPLPRRTRLVTSPQVSRRLPLRCAPSVWNAPSPSQMCMTPLFRAAVFSPTLAACCRPPACMVGAPIAAPLSIICPASRALPPAAETWGSALTSWRPPHQTAHTVVRDYAARTFSSAAVAAPPEPERVRAVCCRRLSGPRPDL